jgi:hypothetical protein
MVHGQQRIHRPQPLEIGSSPSMSIISNTERTQEQPEHTGHITTFSLFLLLITGIIVTLLWWWVLVFLFLGGINLLFHTL